MFHVYIKNNYLKMILNHELHDCKLYTDVKVRSSLVNRISEGITYLL